MQWLLKSCISCKIAFFKRTSYTYDSYAWSEVNKFRLDLSDGSIKIYLNREVGGGPRYSPIIMKNFRDYYNLETPHERMPEIVYSTLNEWGDRNTKPEVAAWRAEVEQRDRAEAEKKKKLRDLMAEKAEIESARSDGRYAQINLEIRLDKITKEINELMAKKEEIERI